MTSETASPSSPGDHGGGRAGLHRFTHDAMACTWEICIADHEARYAGQAARAAFDEVDRLEAALSRFRPDSDIARINAAQPGEPVRVSIDTWDCLSLAAEVHAETAGAFDVSIGALLTDAADGPVGMHLLSLQRSDRTVRTLQAGLTLDLGAIGKGYALDQAAASLRAWSVRSGLVHSGQSTVYALGTPDDAAGWPLALRDPRNPGGTVATVRLRDQALSGSGMLRQGPHILDPRSRRPADQALGAWAICASAARSDALSTAFMVLSSAEVTAYCTSHPTVAAFLFVDSDTGGRLLYLGSG